MHSASQGECRGLDPRRPLLMFFRRERALALLGEVQDHVAPGGRAIVNVLVDGTTYMGMFDPESYFLFGPRELEDRFAGWRIVESTQRTFAAPGETCKVFATVVAEDPGRTQATRTGG